MQINWEYAHKVPDAEWHLWDNFSFRIVTGGLFTCHCTLLCFRRRYLFGGVIFLYVETLY